MLKSGALMIPLRSDFVAWIVGVGGSRYIAGLGFRDCHVDTSLTAIHIRCCDSLSNSLNRSFQLPQQLPKRFYSRLIACSHQKFIDWVPVIPSYVPDTRDMLSIDIQACIQREILI